MALEMFVKEVRVHEFSISPCSSKFVDGFSLMKEFVPTDGIETTEVPPLEAEQEVLSVGLWLELEPS